MEGPYPAFPRAVQKSEIPPVVVNVNHHGKDHSEEVQQCTNANGMQEIDIFITKTVEASAIEREAAYRHALSLWPPTGLNEALRSIAVNNLLWWILIVVLIVAILAGSFLAVQYAKQQVPIESIDERGLR